MKKLEEVPEYICKDGDVNYVSYIDTDSNYIYALPLLKKLYPNFEQMSSDERDDKLEEVAFKYQHIVNKHYDTLAKECFNVDSHFLKIKTECTIRNAYFRCIRRYAQFITKKEGLKKDVLDFKGLEFTMTSFPKVLGNLFEEIINDILYGKSEQECNQKIEAFKKRIFDGEISWRQLSVPYSIQTMAKYPTVGKIPTLPISKCAKGTPIAVKSAIYYNDLLKHWGLSKMHAEIVPTDKVKWIYLKKNPYGIDTIAFLDYDLPEKIIEFIDEYFDAKELWNSLVINKLEGLYGDINWQLNIGQEKQLALF